MNQFSDEANHVNEIKNGFTMYLKDVLEINDINIKGNRITCTIRENQVSFIVTRNDIQYSIK